MFSALAETPCNVILSAVLRLVMATDGTGIFKFMPPVFTSTMPVFAPTAVSVAGGVCNRLIGLIQTASTREARTSDENLSDAVAPRSEQHETIDPGFAHHRIDGEASGITDSLLYRETFYRAVAPHPCRLPRRSSARACSISMAKYFSRVRR